MKTLSNISKVLLVIVLALVLTGCRRTKQYVKSENYNIELKTKNQYSVKYESMYFRTAREEAMIHGEDFKIGVENPIKIKNEKEFNKIKKEYKSKDRFKEVKYSGYKGFQFYTDSYMRNEVYLNINNKYIMRLNVYGRGSNKNKIYKILDSKDVKDILKHMKVSVKK